MLPNADGDPWRVRAMRGASTLIVALAFGILSASARAATIDFDLSRYRGKVVVLDFWASWCKPCRESIPWLNEIHSRYASGGLVVIGVNVDAEHADAEKFLREVPIRFDIAFDPKGDIAQRYQLVGMPTTLVFDRSGKLVQSHVGFRSTHKDDEEAGIKRLLSGTTE